MTTQNFLVEIGTEELPPKALKTLATSFADNVEAELNQAGLSFDKIEWFAAPRRLAVKVLNLSTQQPSKEIEKRGPAVSAAFDAEGKQQKRQKAGRAVVVLPLIKQNALRLIKVNG